MIHAVNNFARGLNTKASPQHLAPEESQELINANVHSGSVVSVDGKTDTGQTDPTVFGHYGTAERSVAKWYDKYYWTDNDTPAYDGDTYTLGIVPPTDPPTLAEAGVGTLTGTFRYCVTYLHTDGWESAPGESDWWSSITVATKLSVELSDIPTKPSNITAINVYRTAADGSEFYLVTAITDDSTTYSDTILDLDLLMNPALETIAHLPPPTGGRYLTERDGVFFVAVGDRLFYSEQSNPHAWNPLSWIGFEDDITATGPELHGILVTTNNRTFRVTGSDIYDIAKQEIPVQQGCPNWRTMLTVGNTPIWLSNDGICIWDGSDIHIITKDRIVLEDVYTHAVAGNDVYYLFHSGGAVCFDHRAGGVFREIDVTCDYAWYDADDDELYFEDDQGIYSFETGDALAWEYQSGWIIGTTLSQKCFRRMLIFSDCPVTLNLYIDGSLRYTAAVAGTGRRQAYLPAGLFGRYAEVKLEGTGTLREYGIEYTESLNI